MKNLFKIVAALAILVSFNSCIDEYGDKTYSGNVVLKIATPEITTATKSELTVSVKLFREYTGIFTNATLKVDSIFTDGTILTAPLSLEFGNYELQVANVIFNKEPIYVAVDDSDVRAIELDAATLIPLTNNVLANETTTFEVSTVLFNPDKDKVEYAENTIGAFLQLAEKEIGTVEGEVIAEAYSDTYGTVTSVTIKDVNGDELLLYGVFKISANRFEVGKMVKASGPKVTYKEVVQMSFAADAGHSIEVLGETEVPVETTPVPLFAGSDFNDWAAFTAALNSYGLTNAEQSADGGRDGSGAMHITGTIATSGYAFTVLGGSATLPANPTKITMYIKGTSSAKSLSCNLYYGESTYDKVNFGTITDASDLALTPVTGNNDYIGTIDTGGEWKKITIDISAMSGAFNTGSELNMFAVKFGKESNYDLYIDDITIE
ncbi:MAG: hypothetical protein ACK5IJ_03215 [Mangrovibacterium sp.]